MSINPTGNAFLSPQFPTKHETPIPKHRVVDPLRLLTPLVSAMLTLQESKRSTCPEDHHFYARYPSRCRSHSHTPGPWFMFTKQMFTLARRGGLRNWNWNWNCDCDCGAERTIEGSGVCADA